jgi:hypothetical protein
MQIETVQEYHIHIRLILAKENADITNASATFKKALHLNDNKMHIFSFFGIRILLMIDGILTLSHY